MNKTLEGIIICLFVCVLPLAGINTEAAGAAMQASMSSGKEGLARPKFKLDTFSEEKRAKLERSMNTQGKRPSSLANEVVAILTDTYDVEASRTRKSLPEYSLSKNDVIKLFGHPSNVSTNKQGDDVLIFDVMIDDPMTKSMRVIIEIYNDQVRRISVAKEL